MDYVKLLAVALSLLFISVAAVPATASPSAAVAEPVEVTITESTNNLTSIDTVVRVLEIRDPGSGNLVGHLLIYDSGRQQVLGIAQ